MRRLNFILLFLVLFSIHFSCSHKNDIPASGPDILISICNNSEIHLKEKVYILIMDYIALYPQFNTFLLIYNPNIDIDLELNKENYTGKTYLLGPAYDGILKEDFPLIKITIENKQIYVKSSLENLINNQCTSFNSDVIPKGSDYILLNKDWKIETGSELFIHRAIFFEIDKDENINVNYRPDTIFTPRLFETTIEFENTE